LPEEGMNCRYVSFYFLSLSSSVYVGRILIFSAAFKRICLRVKSRGQLNRGSVVSDYLYAPPKASLHVAPEAEPEFYIVAPRKYFALYILTFGWYGFYWFYRNWKLYGQYSGRRNWPVMRAMHSIFFIHRLLRHINKSLARQGMHRLRGGFIIVPIYILTMVVSVFITLGTSGKLAADQVSGWMILFLINLLIQMMNGFVIQRAINRATNDPAGQSNSRFSVVNYAWMAVGMCYWALEVLLVILQLTVLLLQSLT
jgi:hypothetical protein